MRVTPHSLLVMFRLWLLCRLPFAGQRQMTIFNIACDSFCVLQVVECRLTTNLREKNIISLPYSWQCGAPNTIFRSFFPRQIENMAWQNLVLLLNEAMGFPQHCKVDMEFNRSIITFNEQNQDWYIVSGTVSAIKWAMVNRIISRCASFGGTG